MVSKDYCVCNGTLATLIQGGASEARPKIDFNSSIAVLMHFAIF